MIGSSESLIIKREGHCRLVSWRVEEGFIESGEIDGSGQHLGANAVGGRMLEEELLEKSHNKLFPVFGISDFVSVIRDLNALNENRKYSKCGLLAPDFPGQVLLRIAGSHRVLIDS